MSKKTKICLVLDLDDTLYYEVDYQTSGLIYVERQIEKLFDVKFAGTLVALRDLGYKDVFLEACKILHLPICVKQSFIDLYRTHFPNISLSEQTKLFLERSQEVFTVIAILTDGRSVSQRQKLHALGLGSLPVYISEEWESSKPEPRRFLAVQSDFKDCEYFCYIGDNPKKDFFAPNNLGWLTFGLKSTNKNIYKQNYSNLGPNYAPSVWVDQLMEIFNYVN